MSQEAFDGLIALIMSDAFTRDNIERALEQIDALYPHGYDDSIHELLMLRFGGGKNDLPYYAWLSSLGAYWPAGFTSAAADIRFAMERRAPHYAHAITPAEYPHVWFYRLDRMRLFMRQRAVHNAKCAVMEQLPQPIAEEILALI